MLITEESMCWLTEQGHRKGVYRPSILAQSFYKTETDLKNKVSQLKKKNGQRFIRKVETIRMHVFNPNVKVKFKLNHMRRDKEGFIKATSTMKYFKSN